MKKLHVIENLDLESIIKDRRYIHLKNIDKYYYVIHLILTGSIRNRSYFKYVKLNQELLREILGGNIALEILRNLVEWNIIDKNEKFLPGSFSQSYRINKDFFNGKITIIRYIPKEFRVCKALNKKPIFKENQLNNFFYDCINKLSFDSRLLLCNIFTLKEKGFRNYDRINLISSLLVNSGKHRKKINSINDFEDIKVLLTGYFIYEGLNDKVVRLKQLLSGFSDDNKMDLLTFFKNYESCFPRYAGKKALPYDIAISSIQDKNYYITESQKTGRMFTNITNLKKAFRYALRTKDNTPLFELDLKNSQPFFLALLVSRYYKGREMPERARKFIDLTTSGELYGYISELPGFEDIPDIKKLKRIIYKHVLFCKNDTSFKSSYFIVLRKEFPEIMDFVIDTKINDHCLLSQELQQMESAFIVQYMGRKFMEADMHYVTIHDSGIMDSEGAELFRKLTKEYFREDGLEPQLHFNELGK